MIAPVGWLLDLLQLLYQEDDDEEENVHSSVSLMRIYETSKRANPAIQTFFYVLFLLKKKVSNNAVEF